MQKINLSKLKQIVEAEKCKKSLSYFVQKAFPIIDTAKYCHNWHIDLICSYLQRVSSGDIKRLIINVPPGHMKSLIVNVMWQAWEWLSHPEKSFINTSHTASLSIRDSIKMRALLESDFYKSINPNFKLKNDQNAKSLYINTASGYRYSLGFGGKATGYRADYIAIDDPISAQSAFSSKQRDKCIEFFDYELSNRLNSMTTGCIVLIMQRLHEDDLTGHLLKQSGWTHLKLPAILEQESDRSYGDIRKIGDLLFPERFGNEVLDKELQIKGQYGFSGQYQQNPVPAEGGLFKKNYFNIYDDLPCDLSYFDKVVISWDLTFKGLDTSDYVAGQVWGVYKNNYYLIDRAHKKMGFSQTKLSVVNMHNKYKSLNKNVTVIVEDAANGAGIKDELKALIPIVLIRSKESKIERAQIVLKYFESGHVFVRRSDNSFVQELMLFGKSTVDDQVDACTQALRYLNNASKISIATRN